jgi:hypothetical protein
MSFVASSFFIISQGFSQEDVSSPSVNKVRSIFINTVKPVLRCHFWNKEKVAYKKGDLLKEVQFILKLSMTDQEKDDLLIQVTA